MNSSNSVGLLLIIGIGALVVGLVMHEHRRLAASDEQARQDAAARAAERAANPPSELQLLNERLDALEAANVARFTSLKERIFWTPLLWAVIGAVLWGIGTALSRA